MATKKSNTRRSGKRGAAAAGTTTSARGTISGPARKDTRDFADAAAAKLVGTNELAGAMPFNPTKAAEYGRGSGEAPVGASVEPPHPRVTASTLTEELASKKTGPNPSLGATPVSLPLDRVRTDATARRITTNLGVPVADNQHSLKAGLRGPALLEDFILREKITHFDHERIPERIVHARGSAAHGYFECYAPMTHVTSGGEPDCWSGDYWRGRCHAVA